MVVGKFTMVGKIFTPTCLDFEITVFAALLENGSCRPMKLHYIKEARKINLETLKLNGVGLGNISSNFYHLGNMIRNGPQQR